MCLVTYGELISSNTMLIIHTNNVFILAQDLPTTLLYSALTQVLLEQASIHSSPKAKTSQMVHPGEAYLSPAFCLLSLLLPGVSGLQNYHTDMTHPQYWSRLYCFPVGVVDQSAVLLLSHSLPYQLLRTE